MIVIISTYKFFNKPLIAYSHKNKLTFTIIRFKFAISKLFYEFIYHAPKRTYQMNIYLFEFRIF